MKQIFVYTLLTFATASLQPGGFSLDNIKSLLRDFVTKPSSENSPWDGARSLHAIDPNTRAMFCPHSFAELKIIAAREGLIKNTGQNQLVNITMLENAVEKAFLRKTFSEYLKSSNYSEKLESKNDFIKGYLEYLSNFLSENNNL